MNTTVRIKASQIYKDWHVIDAAGRPLGRVATEAAILLRGKHKPTYEPHLDDGDFVIVINASQVRVTGRKAAQIKYYTHSGYPGGLKTRSYEDQLAQYPERVLEKAIWGMLPGGPLGKAMFRHLKVYKNANHPHQSQLAGSAKAQEARPAVTAPGPAKPARLRPLSIPQILPEAVAKVAPAPRPAAPKPVKARTAKPATASAAMAAQEGTLLPSEAPPPAEPVTAAATTAIAHDGPTPAEGVVTTAAATETPPKPPAKKSAGAATKTAAKAPAKKSAGAATKTAAKAPAKAATKTPVKAAAAKQKPAEAPDEGATEANKTARSRATKAKE